MRHFFIPLYPTCFVLFLFLFHPVVHADWPMAGQNPQRTSYSNEASPLGTSHTKLDWYKEIPEYIPSKAQVITASDARGGTVYVSTAKGVYALNPANGSTRWFYATSMPVGTSVTVANDIVYVPCLDKTIHAVSAATGQKIWQTLKAGAGFYANPLVANNKVYAGNRDGYFYAFNTSDGSLAWHYPPTINPQEHGFISQSPATNVNNSVIYYTTSTGYVYALNAETGAFIARSEKFKGNGFHVYWPVYYTRGTTATSDDRLFVSSSPHWGFGENALHLYQVHNATINGQPLISDTWPPPGTTIDGTKFIAWLNEDNNRPTVRNLDPVNLTLREMPPVLMRGNTGDNHYPPVIGPDNRVWFFNLWGGGYFGTGGYAGWFPGDTSFKALPSATEGLEAGDEPEAFSMFGGGLFHNDGGDGVDKGGVITMNGDGVNFWYTQTFRDEWPNYGYSWQNFRYGNGFRAEGGWNNVQGTHGYQNPPVPLGKRFFMNKSNNIISYCLDADNNSVCD